MNSKLYRCGWCGCPLDKTGATLKGIQFDKAVRLHESYNTETHTVKLDGDCCGSMCVNPYNLT